MKTEQSTVKTALAALFLASCALQPPVGQQAQALGDQPPIGGFEGIDASGTVRGWALDPDSPATSLTVQLYLDGDAGVGTALPPLVASDARPDVNASTGYTGDHGFAVTMPAATHDGKPHYVYAYAYDAETAAPAPLPLTFVIQPPPPSCVPSCGSSCDVADGCGGICSCPAGRYCSGGGFCRPPCPGATHDCGDGICVRGLCL